MPAQTPVSVSGGAEVLSIPASPERAQTRETPLTTRVSKAVRSAIPPEPSEPPKDTIEKQERETQNNDRRLVTSVMLWAEGWGNDNADIHGTLQTNVTPAEPNKPSAPGTVRHNYEVRGTDANGDPLVVREGAANEAPQSISRAALLRATISELPKTADGKIDQARIAAIIPDEAQRKFFLALCEAQKPDTTQIAEVTDRQIAIEAARSTGRVMLAENVVDMVRALDKITDAEMAQITKPPEKPTDPSAPPVEAPALAALSDEARLIQTFYSEHPIPTRQEVQSLFDSLHIPYSSESIQKTVMDNDIQIKGNNERLEILTKAGQVDQALALKKQNDALIERTKGLMEMRRQLGEYSRETGGKWNTVDAMYDMVESGTLAASADGETYGVTEFIKDFNEGNTDAILNRVIGQDNVIKHDQYVKKQEMKKQLINTSKKVVGAVAAMNAIMIFIAMRKKEGQ